MEKLIHKPKEFFYWWDISLTFLTFHKNFDDIKQRMTCSKIYYENQLEKQIGTGNSNFFSYDYAYNNSYILPV